MTLLILMGIGTCLADEFRLTIEQTNLESLKQTLPTALKLRVQLAKLQEKEFVDSSKALGFLPKGSEDFRTRPNIWAEVYKCSDGTAFIVDNLNMSLWILQDGSWKCLLANLRVDKTMGGARPHMPVLYVGSGQFALSETVPGTVEEKSKDGFPQALAVTFLLDSKTEEIKDRSESFAYDHTPPVRIPDAWIQRYKIQKIEQIAAADRH